MANPKAYSVMYDSLPPPAATSSATAATSSAGGATSAVASGGGNKRPAESQSSSSCASGSGGGLPEGWKRVPSRSRPGTFTYENQYTKERIAWIPDRPASRKMKDLPPEPPRAPKPQRPSDPEEAQRESAAKLKIFLEKLQECVMPSLCPHLFRVSAPPHVQSQPEVTWPREHPGPRAIQQGARCTRRREGLPLSTRRRVRVRNRVTCLLRLHGSCRCKRIWKQNAFEDHPT